MKRKKMFRWISVMALLAAIVMGMSITAYAAENVPYMDGGQQKTASATSVDGLTEWNEGWYVVDKNIWIGDRINVNGNVNLILTDGATLTANNGIRVLVNNSLTIYGQTNGTGTLNATGDFKCAGIGGNGESMKRDCGAVTINGGRVNVKGGQYGAGIGGGEFGYGGDVNINGGTVIAKSGLEINNRDHGAIGRGSNGNGYLLYDGTLNLGSGIAVMACRYHGYPNEDEPRYVDNDTYKGTIRDYECVYIGKAISKDVTFKVEHGKWNDDTADEKTFTVKGCDVVALKLPKEIIPAAGDKPDDKYVAGGWEETPAPGTELTENKTYKYRYIPEPVYDWTGDNSSVTARFTALDGTEISETANTTREVITAPFCEREGEVVYTAKFTNSVFEPQTKKVVLPALGHNWGEATYTWSEDNREVTAKRVCRREPRSHTKTVVVRTTTEVTQPADCETPEETTYTATFPDSYSDAFDTQTKTLVTGEALGHDWTHWAITKQPTDDTPGEEMRSCYRHSHILERRTIPPLKHTHTLTFVPQKIATCEYRGHYAYFECTECEAYFADEEGMKQIGECDTWIYPTGHKAGEPVKGPVTEPTSDLPGGYNLTTYCENCGKVLKEERVVIPPDPDIIIDDAKVVLSSTSFVYNGKVRKPVIKTIAGMKLDEGLDYTVSWSDKSSKKVGTYTVTVTGTGHYRGSAKATYKINPKGTTLSKPKAAKKAATIKWKKQSAKMTKSRITGYKIMLATNKQFTKNKKTVTVKGYSKQKTTVKKLKGGKKYYVKICTYMKVGSKTYTSPWSKAKTVKIKK